MLEVLLLGPVELRVDGEHVPLSSPFERSLAARLAIDVGTVVSVDRLVEDLWPDARPRDAANALRYHVWRLRDVVEPGRPARSDGSYLRTRSPGYVLDASTVHTDVVEFERRCSAARAILDDDPAAAARQFRAGMALFRGEPLAGVDRPFASLEATRLEELRLTATESRIAADIESGMVEQLVPELEGLVAANPFRERLRGQLMQVLYLLGRQVDALAAYRDARRVLGDELGIDPSPELRAIEQQVLLHDERLQAGRPPPRRMVPAATSSIVGREREIDELLRLVEHERLVTVVGPPGVGKTRLALEAAHRIHDDRDVLFIDLAGAGGEDVAVSIAAQLGLAQGMPSFTKTAASVAGSQESVIEYLRRRRALLVMDNCESHLRGAASSTRAILERCDGVQIVATSRRTLSVAGERVFEVEPLTTADLSARDEVGWSDLFESDAETLFIERARAAGARWNESADEARTIVLVCAQLDGLPLAIELAARRARTMSPTELLDALTERFRLLAPGSGDDRTTSLLAALDSSRAMLTAAERAGFDALSVFVGSFGRRAASAVISTVVPHDDADDVLDRLVDHSLVKVEAGPTTTRFRLLDSVRLYASDALQECGSSDVAHRAHWDHVLELVDEAWALRRSAGGLHEAISLLRPERLEILAATRRLIAAGYDCDATRVAATAGYYWLLDGRIDDAGLVCDRVADGRCQDVAIEARLALTALELANWRGDQPDADRAYRLAMAAEDWSLAAEALLVAVLADTAPAGAMKFDDERWSVVSALFERADDPLGAARASMNRGSYGTWQHHRPEASLLLDEAMRTFDSLGDAAGLAEATAYRAAVAHHEGDLEMCRDLLDRCIAIGGDVPVVVRSEVLRNLAQLERAEGDLDRAIETNRRVLVDLAEAAPAAPAVLSARSVNALYLREAGRYDEAAVELIESCSACLRSLRGEQLKIAPWLLEVASGLFAEGFDVELAAVLLAAADATRRASGTSRPWFDSPEYERMRRVIADQLDSNTIRRAEAAGSGLDTESALRHAAEELRHLLSRGDR